MAAVNIDPIYSKSGDTSSNGTTGMANTMTTAANDYTGISANNLLVFTADATNGGYIERIRFKAAGTNTASVARIYINNGSVNTTATNNSFFGELSLPGTTATIIASTTDIDYPMGFALPAGFRIYVGLGTTVAGGWVATPIGGKY
jgi:hypothetical protein